MERNVGVWFFCSTFAAVCFGSISKVSDLSLSGIFLHHAWIGAAGLGPGTQTARDFTTCPWIICGQPRQCRASRLNTVSRVHLWRTVYNSSIGCDGEGLG